MGKNEIQVMTEEERLLAESTSRDFWNTRFCRQYGKFSREPRGKVPRQASGTQIDDGYTQWGYAKEWTQKDTSLNAVNPRVMLAQTYGVLLKGPPGPGEYEKINQGFEKTTTFSSNGTCTVKGRVDRSPPPAPTKTPIDLLSFASVEDRKRRKKVRKIDLKHVVYSGTKINGRAIELLSEEQLREEIKKYGQMPGPNSYARADEPYAEGRVGRLEKWNCKSPQWRLHRPDVVPRNLINFKNVLDPVKNIPGPGAYSLSRPAGKDATSVAIDPPPYLSLTSTKPTSPIGPGSYDVEKGFESTTRMSKVAKAYLHEDMRKPSRFK